MLHIDNHKMYILSSYAFGDTPTLPNRHKVHLFYSVMNLT